MSVPSRQTGMTLPEVMIALLVFALIAATSVYALRLGVDSRDQLSLTGERLRTLQIARVLLGEDLAQIAPRPVRDLYGENGSVVFAGGQHITGSSMHDDERVLFSFVRGGWINRGALAPRSTLQHVTYAFGDGVLLRRSRVFPDVVTGSGYAERVLLEGLDDAYAEFVSGYDASGPVWVTEWPPVPDDAGVPAAVAVVTQEPGKPVLRQMFWTGRPAGGRD